MWRKGRLAWLPLKGRKNESRLIIIYALEQHKEFQIEL